MNFLKKLFSSRGPEDYLTKGDGYYAAHSYYEAKHAYESGLDACQGREDANEIAGVLQVRLTATARAMAELNLQEAEHALRQGMADKALEHLELAKSLTDDPDIREKAEALRGQQPEKINDTEKLVTAHSCGSCSHGAHEEMAEQSEMEIDLPLTEHYDLLIRQLPEEVYERYAHLGEKFASAFIAASKDRHQESLELLEKAFAGKDRDIYCYEKGKLLHRLGRDREAEALIREAIRENSSNPLAHLGLSLLLLDTGRFGEAALQLDHMIANDCLAGQASLMRGELHQHAGETDAAFKMYCGLLDTPFVKAAAEKLYGLLMESGRQAEATQVFKRYLGTCKH